MSGKVQLLIIDAQNDFCDLPADWYAVDPVTRSSIAPSLPVAGAHADLERLAHLIDDLAPSLERIVVTLDSHHRLDIAHPAFWTKRDDSGDGGDVAPFTSITAAQVRAGEFTARTEDHRSRALAYLDALEARGRYTLMVWPVHCQIGTWGHGLHADVRSACDRYEETQQREVVAVFKGMNPWTEHYSAFDAEVPDASDPTTLLNRSLIDTLAEADTLLIAGQASSHCVKATVEDLVLHLPPGHADRLVLLTDCMSPVAGFEAQADGFVATMASCGVRLMTSDEARGLRRHAGRSFDPLSPSTSCATAPTTMLTASANRPV